MITYLKIAVDHDSGEAWFTKHSKELIANWTQECAIFGADITQDILHAAEQLYADTLDTWRHQSEAQREAAQNLMEIK